MIISLKWISFLKQFFQLKEPLSQNAFDLDSPTLPTAPIKLCLRTGFAFKIVLICSIMPTKKG